MAFDVASLLSDLFPSPPPDRAAKETVYPRPQSLSPPSPVRPANRLPGALPTPPLPEWLLRWKAAPEVTLPPKPCGWCGTADFWLSTQGAYRCGRCHPPAFTNMVQMWLRVVAGDDGPQVVRLGDTPSTE